MNNKSIFTLLSITTLLLALQSCRKPDSLELPGNLIIFEDISAGIGSTEDSINLKLVLSRLSSTESTINIAFTPSGLTNNVDFKLVPASANNSISVKIPAGKKESFITIKKVPGVYYYGDEKINFTLTGTSGEVGIGAAKTAVVNFSEIISSYYSTTIDGGGPTYPNKVFIDLSANRQKAVMRTTWDLGFYTDPASWSVILNSSSAMMAKATSKNDMNAVSAADTIGLTSQVSFSLFAPDPLSLPYIDYPNGDLSRTAIAAISANDADNKVYIVNRGMGIGSPAPSRGWKKIRILRNGTGYKLQYADIAATNFLELNIAKNSDYFFNYISLDGQAADVEPAKDKWDIAWTHFSNTANFGTGEVPYLYQDIILLNRNVQVAKIMTATKPFDSFAETDLSVLNYTSLQTGIGADWRSGGGPTSGPAVRTDRYYIVKDSDNNYYKLRFTSLTQNGQRGYPSFEAVLVKKG